MHDDSPRGSATLAGGANCAEENRAHSQIEIGALRHNNRIVSAELEQCPTKPLRDPLRDACTHRTRAGGRDEWDPFIASHAVTHDLGTAGDQSENGRIRAGFAADLFGNASDGDGAKQRFVGGLPQDRIAADGRERAVPGPNRNGKVESGDDADQPKRMPLLHEPVFRTLGLNRESVELARKTDGKIADVDHLLHFAFSFGQNFAGLDGYKAAELLFEFAQGVAKAANGLSTNRRGHSAPFQECVVGALNGALVIIGGRQTDLGDWFAIDRRGWFDYFTG